MPSIVCLKCHMLIVWSPLPLARGDASRGTVKCLHVCTGDSSSLAQAGSCALPALSEWGQRTADNLPPRLLGEPSHPQLGSPGLLHCPPAVQCPPMAREASVPALLLNGPRAGACGPSAYTEIFLSLEKCFSVNPSSMCCRFVFVFRWKHK